MSAVHASFDQAVAQATRDSEAMHPNWTLTA